MQIELNVEPRTKPRMTISDKWKKRPCVLRYREYKDLLREELKKYPNFELKDSFKIIFILPIKNKKNKINDPHKQRPDIDNFLKGFLDAVLEEDSYIWDVHSMKIWGDVGKIIIIQ